MDSFSRNEGRYLIRSMGRQAFVVCILVSLALVGFVNDMVMKYRVKHMLASHVHTVQKR